VLYEPCFHICLLCPLCKSVSALLCTMPWSLVVPNDCPIFCLL
jgi:hypothetical protein